MFYEEQIIDGVLHWRGTPDGEFVPFTAKRLTDEVMDLRAACEVYRDRVGKAKAVLEATGERG